MSYNVRYDNPEKSAHPWRKRQDHVASVIQFHDLDVVARFDRYRNAGHIPASTLEFYVDDVEVTVADDSILLRKDGAAT